MSSAAPNFHCAQCVHNETGLCAASYPTTDSMKGQCNTCPPGHSWNYAISESSQNRCAADDANEVDFLKGPFGPGSMSPENGGRLRSSSHFKPLPQQLMAGSLELPFLGSTPAHSTANYTQNLSTFIPGGLDSARAPGLMRGGRRFAAICPQGWTDCGAQGMPRAGSAGGPCVPEENLDCQAGASWNGRSWYPTHEVFPLAEPWPPLRAENHPPQLGAGLQLQSAGLSVYPTFFRDTMQRSGGTSVVPFM